MNQPTLSIEEIARYPLAGMAIPSSFTFSPENAAVVALFSPDASLSSALYRFDPQSGARSLLAEAPGSGITEAGISIEEALRRERQRQRGLGITHYAWIGKDILLPLQGAIYLFSPATGVIRCLVSSENGACLDPHAAPDGRHIAYAQNGELFTVPTTGGQPRQLTTGARETGKTHGLAEFIAQEEMGRAHGYWWSPDSHAIAFEEVDETHIPVYRILHQGKDITGQEAQEDHRYPFAGQPNARVRLGVVRLDTAAVTWMHLGNDPDFYLARVHWLPDGSLAAQVQNRAQTELSILRFDPASGQSSVLLHETSPVWINLHNIFHPIRASKTLPNGGFLWASERSGFRHLYLYDLAGNLVCQLTSGDWMVDSLTAVDAQREQVYFMATRATPLDAHLYRVSFDGEDIVQITTQPGTHAVSIDPAFQRFVDVHSSTRQPPLVTLRSLADDSLLATLHDAADDPRIAQLDLQPPELVNLSSRDGVDLFGAIYRPPAAYGAQPFPTIVNVYGGPHVQNVTNSWSMTVNMRAQYLRSLGFLVFVLDNRGGARRGFAFESAIHLRMGSVEVDDQVDGVRWLVAQGLTDPQRVGIYGWSYGGYMAALCLAKAPDVFRAAVAGAPVTHMDGYDTHYTERYMRTPQANPIGYAHGSVVAHVENIRGRLMLIHGLIDENVHFRHTARLINALIQARKPYDLLLFPNERHMPRGFADRVYMEERIRDFFLQNL